MKKFFLAIAMVAMLGFVAVPANALIGVPDDVPGTDILVPWFYVSMPGFGSENTLMTVTEVKGFRFFAAPNAFSTQVLGWVQDIDSETVFDFGFNLTRFDVWSGDALSLIALMTPMARAALEIDTDGDGINDHWAGYVVLFNNSYPRFTGVVWQYDNLISNCYQVYLAGGMAASFNGASLEWGDPANVFNLMADPIWQGNGDGPGGLFPDTTWAVVFGDEVFSANALVTGKSLLATGILWGPEATFMRLMPRYYVNDAVGESLLMIWTDRRWTENAEIPPPPIPPFGWFARLPGSVHCNFFNEDEIALSANLPIDHELNIIRIRDVIPAGLFAAYPWAGWINIQTPDTFGNGWFTDDNINGINDGAERQWLVYSWQRAIGPAAQAWEVIHKAHRDTDQIF